MNQVGLLAELATFSTADFTGSNKSKSFKFKRWREGILVDPA
jgi:hypothetical protein